jgi:photosystem II stability/assembly factor-like uncharacterized protein
VDPEWDGKKNIMRKHYWFTLGMTALMLMIQIPILAQMKPIFHDQEQAMLFNESTFRSMQWRNIGPFRGGRSNAVTGVKNDPMTYYMGTVGGGLWKTVDAGISWVNISDGFFQTASVGAVAVANSDPNIIYVGMGEHAVRGVMSSYGDGVYRSTDAGKTWQHLGLAKTKHISKVIIHPENPDKIWVAAQGAAFGPSRERGIYTSEDGGQTWEQILFVNPTTGASDLSIDLHNPRIIYAAMWDHQRKPWHIRSGGRGSGIYKSSDGGNNWQKLSSGLPDAMGKVGVAVSQVNPNIVYGIIEAEKGGVFRSEDAGANWQQVSTDRATIGRAWYYTKIVADPVYEKGLYVLNAPLLHSDDGGHSYDQIDNPHTDQHDLWINPDNPKNMILANDGGACITFNGGKSWSSQENQPTAQLYRLTTDHQFPYNIYAAQQDNTSFRIPSRTASTGITQQDWSNVGDSESAFIAVDPEDPTEVFSTNYLGNIISFNQETGFSKNLMAYPNLGLAALPKDQKYRFNWNAPLVMSPFDNQVLYHAANVVLKSTNRGMSWAPISPDLTRDEELKQGPGGGPFTNEGAGGEVYNTISYLVCSQEKEGEIWVGTDDGRVHFSPNDGAQWKEITPENLGEAQINSIELSAIPGRAYIVATRHKFNNIRPIILKTENYGKSWELITEGIPSNTFARVLREDPKMDNILYVGTETGLFISFDQGKQWHPFQLNLPVCPITDLIIQDNDLIAATAGRSIWILDDLSPIQQYLSKIQGDEISIITPKDQVRFTTDYYVNSTRTDMGLNPPDGIYLDYYIPDHMTEDTLVLAIYDRYNKLVRSFRNVMDSTFTEYEGGPPAPVVLPIHAGINRFVWDLRRNTIPGVDQIFVYGDYRGGVVPPGYYTARLSNGKQTTNCEFAILADPRIEAEPKDYEYQARILREIEKQVADIHLSINKMRVVRDQIHSLVELLERSNEHKDLISTGRDAIQKIQSWELSLIQTKQQTYQDAIHLSNGLNAELLDLKQKVDTPSPNVTEGAKERLQNLTEQWAAQKALMENILNQDVGTFNEIFKEKNIPALIIPKVSAF